MPVLKLTDLTIEHLPPCNVPELYIDASMPGFGIRVGKRTKTFVVIVGSTARRKVSIGKYPATTLKAARRAAAELMDGTSVVPSTKSFLEAFRAYSDVYISPSYRPRAAREVTRIFTKHCGDLEALKLSAITSTHCSDIFDRLRATPSEANHLFGVLRTFFTWCEKRDYLARSPLTKLSKPYKEQSRSRLLSDEEIAKIYIVATKRADTFSRIILLCLLSGQRRGEIAQMHRSWIDPTRKVFVIPATVAKNGIEHTVPYTDTMAAIFADSSTPLLFPARGTANAFSGFGASKEAFDATCGVSGFTIHDLRRYFSTSAPLQPWVLGQSCRFPLLRSPSK